MAFGTLAEAAEIVGHWSFDDGSADDPVNLNNGLLINGSGTSSIISGGGGFLGGQSLSLQNASTSNGARVEVAHAPSLAVGNNLSISFWTKALNSAQPNDFSRALSKNGGGTTDPGWEYQRNGSGTQNQIRIDTSTSGNQLRGSGSSFDGNWHHVVTTLSSGIRGCDIGC